MKQGRTIEGGKPFAEALRLKRPWVFLECASVSSPTEWTDAWSGGRFLTRQQPRSWGIDAATDLPLCIGSEALRAAFSSTKGLIDHGAYAHTA